MAMMCHLGAGTHHPYLQTPARSDLALAVYSGSGLQGVAGVHRECKINKAFCPSTVLCYMTKDETCTLHAEVGKLPYSVKDRTLIRLSNRLMRGRR